MKFIILFIESNMAINLFDSIFNKTNSWLTPSAGFIPSQTTQQPTIPYNQSYKPFISPEQDPTAWYDPWMRLSMQTGQDSLQLANNWLIPSSVDSNNLFNSDKSTPWDPNSLLKPISEVSTDTSNRIGWMQKNMNDWAYNAEQNKKDTITWLLQKWYNKDAIVLAMKKLDDNNHDWSQSFLDNPIKWSLAAGASAVMSIPQLITWGIWTATNTDWMDKSAQNHDSFGTVAWNIASQSIKWVSEMALGAAMGWGFWTTKGIIYNDLFSAKPVQEAISENLTKPIISGVKTGQEALWLDPNSYASKNVQDIGGTLWTLWAFHVGSKWVDAGLSKGSEFMKNRMKSDPTYIPPMDTWNNAMSSESVQGNVQKPWIVTNVQDKVFWPSSELELAGKAVSPRSVKSKWPNQKLEWNANALSGLQQLHDDSIAWKIDADIGTMQWWAEWIEQALDIHGKRIGELTKGDAKVKVSDIVWWLEKQMENPLSWLSWPVKSIANSIIDVFKNKAYKDWMTISDIQQAMSDIKSQIFSDNKLVQALKKETAGRWVSEFINTLSDRFNKAIDDTSGNSIELAREKKAYSRLKGIQDDLMQSLLVNNRNSKTGATGKAGTIVALYELSKGWLWAIPKVMALKYITGTMGEYWTRSGAYEKLIRTLDRKALQRSKWEYNTGDTSILNLKKNGWNSSNNSSGMASKKPIWVNPTFDKWTWLADLWPKSPPIVKWVREEGNNSSKPLKNDKQQVSKSSASTKSDTANSTPTPKPIIKPKESAPVKTELSGKAFLSSVRISFS